MKFVSNTRKGDDALLQALVFEHPFARFLHGHLVLQSFSSLLPVESVHTLWDESNEETIRSYR